MTDTPNLGLPFIEGSQAQKHVTHNEALRILDAAIQISVLDLTRTAPPSSPAEGERHVVAAGATGAWAGHANAIATWQDGAWAFLVPKAGWCVWSSADAVTFVFDGTVWRDQRNLAVDNLPHLGINTTASLPNLLSVKSNAVLLAAVNAADGGSGDARLQISKESAAKTASVFFSDAFSGRAEFGLVGSDAFKLKVSADGSTWVEAFNVDQTSGNLALPRGLALTGVISPPQITANQNDYAPTGAATASVLQLTSDASRTISGLAGGAEGRVVSVVNIGSQPIALTDESTSSSAANRFTLGGTLTIAAKQAAMLRYDGTASRWRLMSGATGLLAAANNLSDLASAAVARANLGVREMLSTNRTYYVRTDGSNSNTGLVNSSGGAFLTVQKAVDTVAALDCSIYQVTIQIVDPGSVATFTAAVTLRPYVGLLPPIIQGNAATPANVLISTSTTAFANSGAGAWQINDLKIVTSAGNALSATNGGTIRFQNLDFGAVALYHIFVGPSSNVMATGNYAVSGGAQFHVAATGYVSLVGMTVTYSGSPAFSSANILAGRGSVVDCYTMTFVNGGTVTGPRYSASMNGVIFTNTGGLATYLPGNAAGTSTTGGQYL
jgi:hypothetical protein